MGKRATCSAELGAESGAGDVNKSFRKKSRTNARKRTQGTLRTSLETELPCFRGPVSLKAPSLGGFPGRESVDNVFFCL